MKTIIFVMILATPTGGLLPTFEEQMDTLEACQVRAAEATANAMTKDEDFGFAAACRIQSKKSNPA